LTWAKVGLAMCRRSVAMRFRAVLSSTTTAAGWVGGRQQRSLMDRERETGGSVEGKSKGRAAPGQQTWGEGGTGRWKKDGAAAAWLQGSQQGADALHPCRNPPKAAHPRRR
jgi:hypothetical protein